MTSELTSGTSLSHQAQGGGAGQSPRRTDTAPQGLAAIFDLIRRGESNTRHDLERHTGLGRAIVADRVANLIEFGLVEEGDLGPAKGGRAPRLVRFRQTAGVILVAFFDKSMLSVGIADLSGKLLVEHHEEADITVGPEATIKRLETLFDWALEQHGRNSEVWGIGIALPGPIESGTGPAFTSPTFHFMPNWGAYPIVAHLAQRHQAPVWLRSGVEAMTLGEYRAGQAAGQPDFVFVKLGRGISAGLVSNGRLHRGALGGAGLIGHVRAIDHGGEMCVCGNVGCLDTVAGGDAIAQEANRAATDGRSARLAAILASKGAVDARDVGDAAQQGDPFSADLLARCGRAIGTVLAGTANLFNPALIVLGGDVTRTDDILLAAIRQEVYRQSHPLVSRDLRIVSSQMGGSAGLVGSAHVVVQEIFGRAFVEHWIGAGTPLCHPEVSELIATAPAVIARSSPPPQPPRDNALDRVLGHQRSAE